MLAKTGTVRSAIATFTANAAQRTPMRAGAPRRPRRTETTMAAAVARICSNPKLENGLGTGLRLCPSLTRNARTRTARYARKTHQPGRRSGSIARTARYVLVPLTDEISDLNVSRNSLRRAVLPPGPAYANLSSAAYSSGLPRRSCKGTSDSLATSARWSSRSSSRLSRSASGRGVSAARTAAA